MAANGLRADIAGSFPFVLGERRLIMVTGHRRESFGEGFERICQALREIATRFPDVDIVYPVHPNPNVRTPVMRWVPGIAHIHLIDPRDTLPFVFPIDMAHLNPTDSPALEKRTPLPAQRGMG